MSLYGKTFAAVTTIFALAAAAVGDPARRRAPANFAIKFDSKIVLGTLPPANIRMAQADTQNFSIGVRSAPNEGHSYSCSPDARDMTVVCQQGKNYSIWHKGAMSKPYSYVTAPFFSPDSSRFAFIATTADPPKAVIVVDGKEQGPFVNFSAEGVHWSRDGKHIAYFATDGDGMLSCVLDGVMSEQKFHNAWGPFFSPDSKHCMYNAESDGIGLVMDDSKAEGSYNGTLRPFWSPDSKHTAMGVHAREGDKPYVMLCDGKLDDASYEVITDAVYSPDSKKIAYTAKVQWGYQCVVDGKNVGKVVGGHYGGTLQFLPDSKSVRWIGSTSKIAFAYFIDGEPVYQYRVGGIAPMGGHHTFSPDGRHLAFEQFVGDLGALVKTGQKKFTAGKDFKTQVLVDKQIFEPFDDVWSLEFSPDSKHFAAHVILGEGKQSILADGVQGAVYPKIMLGTPKFSPDSSHLAYLATKADGKSVLVVDGVDGPEFEEAVKGTPLVWVDNQTLRFVMIDKLAAESVTWKILPKAAVK